MPRRTIEPAGELGFVGDRFEASLEEHAWTGVSNMRFRDEAAERMLGHGAVFTAPSASPYHLAPFETSAAQYWVHSTLTAAYADDGPTRTDITGTALTGAAADRFTSCVLGGVYVQTNQVQVPMSWDGNTANNLAALTGWDATWRCGAIRSFKAYLIALNITKGSTRYPFMVKWSHAADPGTLPASWDETDPALDAGEQDLAETSDEVLDGLALGDTFVIYKRSSVFGMQYVGGTQIFRFFRIPGDFGVLSQNCVAATPKGHVCLTTSDVVIHNGAGPESILTGRLKKWLFSQIGSENHRLSFVVANPAQSEVWICFPGSGASVCTKALIWNWDNNTWTRRALPNVTAGAIGPLNYELTNTWAADTETWAEDTTTWGQADISAADRRLVMASTAPALYLMDYSAKFAGVAFSASLERLNLALDAPDMVKRVKRVVPRIDAAPGCVVNVQVGGAMRPEDGPAWSAAVPYTVGSSLAADVFASGKFISIRFSSTEAKAWKLAGYDIEYEFGGRW